MSKAKRFSLVGVLSVILLFVIGNSVASVKATEAVMTGLTPVPTPTVNYPVTLAEEVPTLEEQENMKTLIEAYFDIRYRALSVSGAKDFKESGFGNLISSNPDAGDFLNAELGRLAVEIKHAELNDLQYVDYKYSLDFDKFSIDFSTG